MSKSDAVHQREMDVARNREEAIDVLLRTIWGEARGEPREGKIAVANVVTNRVKRPRWWGRTIVTVCLKAATNKAGRTVYQFTAWDPEDPNRAKMLSLGPSDPAYAECLEIATKAVDGDLEDITGGATHYLAHAVKEKTEWDDAMKPTVVIGNHAFFQEA